jgi:inhibitor of KinA sporulation pathway (predicted exonuclease)
MAPTERLRLTEMADLLPEILVVDVEATCWRGPRPVGEMNEIIEIGVCLLAPDTGERSRGDGILVRPQRSKVSEFCTELTTLTQEQVDQGIDFAAACELLRTDYQADRRVWASYGAYDKNQFCSQCAAFGEEYPFSAAHINVKARLAPLEGWESPKGMGGALRRLGFPLEGTHHRGVDDAWNIALILRHMLLERGAPVRELLDRDE